MSELEALKIGGPLALSIIVIWFIVKEFLKVITNHMRHDLEAHERVIEVLNDLKESQQQQTITNNRLLDFLTKKF